MISVGAARYHGPIMDTDDLMQNDNKLSSLDLFLDAFEAEFGRISPEEIAEATRRTRARAIIVRLRQV